MNIYVPNVARIMEKYTRFRAYHLGEKGASFSLSVDNDFTLIEAGSDLTLGHIQFEG